MNNYLKLEEKIDYISKLKNLLYIVSWDMSTMMPELSASSRGDEVATLSDLIHKMFTSQETKELIDAASEETGLDEWQQANLRHIKKSYLNNILIDPKLLLEFNKAKAEGEMVWRKARQNNDFNSFKPYLEKLLDLQITIASIKAQEFNKKIYDVLIDSYDPDQEADNLIPIHNKLKAWLPGFIDKVIEKQAKESFHPLRRQFDKLKQKEFGIRIMKVLGFDFNQGRLDESVHPFCGGTPFDIRITTRYEEDEFILALEGIIHETGHALYELNRPAKYKNQPVGKALGMSMHESQSLFMEMQIGRSFSFMQYLSPLLNEFWGSNEMFTPENLYLNVSRVQKGFIRVDADEVTYPLHVIMRFEIEYALINRQIKVDDIPHLWNEKFKEYFGITPPNDRLGCLQDIHWSWGGFGYFPSYLNGAIIASNLMTKAKEKISNLEAQISKGEFTPVNNFLKENIHSKGSLYKVNELLEKSTGSVLNVENYMQYLNNKFLNS